MRYIIMTKRKIVLLIFVLFFAMSTALYSSTTISNFTATVTSSIVKLDWDSGTENNVKYFIVEKSSDNINFEVFNNIRAKGNNSSYLVLDKNPYDKSVLYYRIVVEDYDGTKVYSNSQSVEIISSGLSATWGSIKAMFR